MITTKTLLILGAGASVPYGYPSGFQLKDELIDPSHFSDVPFLSTEGIEIFCQQFKESQLYSIDAFLAKRSTDDVEQLNKNGESKTFGTYAEIGKIAITHQLISREQYSKRLFQPEFNNYGVLTDEKTDHWMQYLWNHLCDGNSGGSKGSEFSKNQLKIISFNYDRVLEHYLQTTLKNTFGLTTDRAKELRDAIEIIHVYGNLQDLEQRPYGESPKNLTDVAKCIRVIPEARQDDEKFEKAKQMIDWADKICFIGFSFDKTNVERLGFRPDHDYGYSKKIYATQYGMTILEIGYAEKLLGFRFAVSQNGELSQFKTLEYLRHSGFLLDL